MHNEDCKCHECCAVCNSEDSIKETKVINGTEIVDERQCVVCECSMEN